MLPQAADMRSGRHALRPFPEVPAVLDLPSVEREVLGRWAQGSVFTRSLAQTASGPRWTCYEAPLAANGMPGLHHVPARAVTDLYQRFKTMQGFHVPRRGGWDCHGLPVEVAVEKELGLAGKKGVEEYGVEQFNARCRESVLRHVEAFTALTHRMGYWVDLSQAYRTMDAGYVESVWWSLRQIFDAGLLVREYRVGPYCPRCQTALSELELGQPQVFKNVSDTAATVRLRLLTLPAGANRRLAGADLLVWTADPWTLVANSAVAVHPDATYALARRAGHDEQVIVAEALFARVLGSGWHIAARITGAELAGASYRPAFSLTEVTGGHRVIASSLVTTQGGTGLVHLAPAFGAGDMEAARSHGLPAVNPVGPDGRFDLALPLVGGIFFKDADPILIADLSDRGLLFASHRHQRSDPHCWRCGTPLLRYASSCWHIRLTAIRAQLLAENERTAWVPASAGDDQGDWLRGASDWTLSRTRYWGTPLPLWECEHGHLTCVGSLAELSELAGRDLTGLDPHRPDLDRVAVRCPRCGVSARRVPDVIDAWYDCGSMPFAQHGAPLSDFAELDVASPAHLVAEGADKAKGWFFALMTIGSLVGRGPAFQSALRLGNVVDEHGRTMTKSLGNVVKPLPLIERHGADALRWFFTAATPPWATKQVSTVALDDIVSKVLLAYWDAAAFFLRSANAAARGCNWRPGDPGAPPPAGRPLLDRWILSELHSVVSDVTADLESFQSDSAGRRITNFIDDLSRWYLRRSRRRFFDGPKTSEGAAAFATLHECLETVTRLIAPIAPFLSDYVWDLIRTRDAPESVHLAAWPVALAELIDDELATQMELARKLAELGRSARAATMIQASQPLTRALIAAGRHADLTAELLAQVAEELNVKAVERLVAAGSELSEPGATPTFGEVIVTQSPLTGWAVAAEGAEVVALDIVITPALRREGLAREFVSKILDARKLHGLEAGDQIAVRWSTADTELTAALAEHETMISAEVLAAEYGAGTATQCAGAGTHEHVDAGLGITFWLRPLSS